MGSESCTSEQGPAVDRVLETFERITAEIVVVALGDIANVV